MDICRLVCRFLFVSRDRLKIEKLLPISIKGGSRGEARGSGPPLKNHKKNIGFLSNAGTDPLKKPAFNVGQSSARQRNAIFKWPFAGWPMMAHL